MNLEACTRKIARLRRVASHVDSHLQDPLSLDDLADIAHMSRYHFERVFAAYAGETPLARVRRLRLQLARQRIEHGRSGSLLDLALDCGYASAEAFSRAFRACHGCAPSDIRSQAPTGEIPPIRIETLPARPIQYLHFKGMLDESIAPFDALRAHALVAGIPRERRKGWCVQLSGDMGDPTRPVELLAALGADQLGTTLPGLAHGTLPGGTYAVLRISGGYASPPLPLLAQRIVRETGLTPRDDAPMLRCFQNNSYLPAGFEKRYDLYVPLTD